MKNNEIVVLKYNGSAVEGGVISAFIYAHALTGLSHLINAINYAVNDHHYKIEVKVTAQRVGSFETEVVICAEKVVDLFNSNPLIALISFKEVLVGLFNAYNYISINNLRTAEKVGDAYEITLPNGLKHRVKDPVMKSISDSEVRSSCWQVVEPLKHQGFDSLSIGGRQDSFLVRKESLNLYNPLNFDEAALHNMVLTQNTVEMVLKVAYVALDPINKWRFSDGENTFYAKITDRKFIEEFEAKKIGVYSGTVMQAEVEIMQIQHLDSIKKHYEIKKVLGFTHL